MKKRIAIYMAVLLLLCLPACMAPGDQETSSIINTSAWQKEESPMTPSNGWWPPNPTQEEFTSFQNDLEQRLDYVKSNAGRIDTVEISFYKRGSTEKVELSSSDAQLISRWLSFLDKIALSYKDYEPIIGTVYHDLMFIINGKEFTLDSGWNAGHIYVGANQSVMAVITNFHELSDEYNELERAMGFTVDY